MHNSEPGTAQQDGHNVLEKKCVQEQCAEPSSLELFEQRKHRKSILKTSAQLPGHEGIKKDREATSSFLKLQQDTEASSLLTLQQ